MATGWIDLMVKEKAYREFIDVESLKDKRLEMEGPIDLHLVLWLLSQGIMPAVHTPGFNR